MTDYITAALYQFTPLTHFQTYQKPLQRLCEEIDVMGTLLLAREGINGTVCGSRSSIDSVLEFIKTEIPGCQALEHQESVAPAKPFNRMKVRLKNEIVTMGVTDVNPNQVVGIYVEPAQWNELICDPDVMVIDTRNDYEVSIGTFQGAIDPHTRSFRDFPIWVQNHQELTKDKKIAMFCTGGIRCEKATSYLCAQGFKTVYHLKGGILKYLETVPKEESMWHGDCFVFDQRVSVRHGLEVGDYDMCHACRYPIGARDKMSPHYRPGVSCPNCYDQKTDQQRRRFADRQKQIDLARERGLEHLGHKKMDHIR